MPASAEEIRRFGPGALLMRQALDRLGWGPGDLNQAIGRDRNMSGAWQWVNSRQAVPEGVRPDVARALGLKAEDLIPVGGSNPRGRHSPRPPDLPPVKQDMVRFVHKPEAPAKVPEVMGFSVLADGNARVRLDVVLPFDKASILMRTLMDQGLLLGGGGTEQ